MRALIRKTAVLLGLLLLFVAAHQTPADAQGYSNGYSSRRTITIDHTKVPNTDQTNFPFLFSGTYPYLATTSNGGGVTSASGYDVIFTSDSAGTTGLPFERESYNGSTGAVSFWVQIPTVSHTTDTVIYLFYGNSSVTVDPSSASGTWDTNYKAVWHLPNGTTLTANDSTSGAHNGTLSGSTPPAAAAGKIGGGAGLNGSTAFIDVPGSSSLEPSSAITVSAWVKYTTANNYAKIFGRPYRSTSNWSAPYLSVDLMQSSGTTGKPALELAFSGTLYSVTATTALNDGSWHYIVGTYDGSNMKIYEDGQLNAATARTGTIDYSAATLPDITLGSRSLYNNGEFFNGNLDEIRLSSNARSADWITAEYKNQNSPFTFYGEGTPAILSLSSNTADYGNAITITGRDFGASPGSSTVTIGGLAATVTSWSATSIVATVPVGAAASGSVVVTVGGVASNTASLTVWPGGWSDGDIGPPGASGSMSYANGKFTVLGAGGSFGSTSDAFNFAYQQLSGDGTIVARIASLQPASSGNPEVGVMIRETLAAGSNFGFAGYNKGSTDFFMECRTTTGASASGCGSPTGFQGLPNWVKLVRSGTTFTAYQSLDGQNWSSFSSQTISMATNVYIGLAVNGTYWWAPATTVFDNVSISGATSAPLISSTSATTGSVGSVVVITGSGFGASQNGGAVFVNDFPMTIGSWSDTSITMMIPSGATTGYLVVAAAPSMNSSNPIDFEVTTTPLPSPWLDSDVGIVGSPGSATFASDVFTVLGTGTASSGFSGTTDTFHYVYQQLSGDGTIVARLSGLQAPTTGNYYEAGIMIRETLNTGATMAFMGYQPANGNFAHFTYRTSTGGSTSNVSTGSAISLPEWFMLIRSGNTFKAYLSSDGVNWTQLGSTQTISMASNVYVGLAVTSSYPWNTSTGTFDNVVISPTATQVTPVITSLTPSAAPIGGSVTIQGTDFGSSPSSSTVHFNSVAASSITSWTNTSITLAVPSSAGSGSVTVTVGGVVSNGETFTLIEGLSTSGISPSFGPLGTSVTISGAGFGPTQSNSALTFYGSSTAPTISSWSDTSITAIVPTDASTGPVWVTVAGNTALTPTFMLTSGATVTDSLGNVTHYSAELMGGQWLFTASDGSGCSTCTSRGVIQNTFDSNGNRLSTTDALGHATAYGYDTSNNLLSQTAPVNSTTNAVTSYTYNGFGEVVTATDPLGNVTTNAYDSHGNLTSVTTPAPGGGASASVTTFTYNSIGELTQITDPLGHNTTMTYTSAGLVATVTDAQSNVTTYAYDAHGNRTSITDALSHQTTFAYDTGDRLTTITYPDSTTTTFTYDIRGRRTSVTDQNGKTTNYAYDLADRLTSVTDAASNATAYAYDTEDNLTTLTDANSHATYFTYDAYGRVTQTNFPSSTSETYAYDANNNLTSKTDRKSQTITYAHDYLNRLTQKTYPDTTSVGYTYDLAGKVTQVTDPTGTYSFSFDSMGRLTGTTTSYSFLTGRSFTNGYAYDAASNRTGFTDPESGTTSYSYDTLNRLTSLAPPSAFGSGSFGFSYDGLSRQTQMTRPNGVTSHYSYDSVSRLLSVLHQVGSSTIDGDAYTLDAAGNRTAKGDYLASVMSNYTYDALYQLTQVTQGGTTKESYSYDPVGNRTASLGVSSYTTNSSNELTATSNASYTYDYNGNTLTKVVSSNTTTYAWDYENRLTSVTLPSSGGTVTFKYDPLGRRIYKSLSTGGTSVFAYDGDNLIEETNSSGTVVARYSQTENIDEPLAMLRSSTTSYYNADGLGSVTSLANGSGTLTQSYAYDSFGKTTPTGSVVNPFQYTGRELDSETGLYYYRARYYDQSAGRFLGEDPVEFDGGDANLYRYVRNSPTNLVDQSGLSPGTNWNFFWDWVLGRGQRTRNYGPNDTETQEMQKSSGAQVVRNLFYQKGCKTVTDVGYGSAHAFEDTVTSPGGTPFQVGGFAGASARNNGNGTVSFDIPNVAGTHSFFYHIVPDRSSPTGPMSNISQDFRWTEPIDSNHCGCK